MSSNSSSNSYKARIPGSEKVFRLKIEKQGQAFRMIRGLLYLVIFLTFVGNAIFIFTHFLNGDSTSANAKASGYYPYLREAEEDRVLDIDILSSKDNLYIKANGKVVNDAIPPKFTGIYVVVLNQVNGAKMASEMFYTYTSERESDELIQFLEGVSVGRIICFAVMDEASHFLKTAVRKLIKSYGSMYFARLQWRDLWAFVVQKRKYGGRVLAEGFQKCPNPYDWPSDVMISTSFLAKKESLDECQWEDNEQNRRRKKFCEKYEGYPIVCRCINPISIDFDNTPFADGSKLGLPVAVIAGNRPHYLFRMLLTLKNVIGLNASLVTVYIDGFFDEPAMIGKLFNLKVDQHEPVGRENARISQHYKKSLTKSFDDNPEVQYLVVLEEDLDVAVDILSFFKQLLPVLEKDDSLFCISAWNDQGYKHSTNDVSLTYRIEYMPGLGWVLPRKIYKNELEPDWPTPDKMWDWDMWIRFMKFKGRECVIPDISRSFHFGSKGINMNPYWQDLFFEGHAFNKEPFVKINADLMYKENYENEIHRLARSASVLSHTITPCSHPKTFIPKTRGETYVYYIKMENDDKNWINTAHCLSLWDNDVRGMHKAMFRFWSRGNQLLVIGCPDSPYCKYKPDHVIPAEVRKIDNEMRLQVDATK